MEPVYDAELREDIRDNVDLLEYISQSLEIEQRGKRFYAHCPLHTDNTASLYIDEDENTYYCFSCGRGGDIISYLMDYEHMSFQGAMERGTELAKIDISKRCHSKTVSFLKMFSKLMNKEKKIVVHPILDASILDKYDQELPEEWLNEGIQPEVMSLFGVRIDKYSNRIVYPVYDINGNLINVKGRTRYTNFKELGLQKYINYYKVGTMDYFQGLNITRPFIEQKKEIIIFESIKSVMLAYGWGYKNCVSAEKHTLTDEQIDLLITMDADIVFAYDSDVSYYRKDVDSDIEKLRRIKNIYAIMDRNGLLGGAKTKNAPVDLGREVWEQLYSEKRKIV